MRVDYVSYEVNCAGQASSLQSFWFLKFFLHICKICQIHNSFALNLAQEERNLGCILVQSLVDNMSSNGSVISECLQ